MRQNPFAPDHDQLPRTLPVFPLEGVLLLPHGNLPLNVFEARYMAMVEDVLATPQRLIGIIQPDSNRRDTLYQTGCAGKIKEFSETEDGRYLVSLTGVCRFKIRKEIRENKRGYRQVKPNWAAFSDDLKEQQCLNLDRGKLQELLQQYFHMEGMECDWQAIRDAPDGKLITCLSMACPFNPQEKQALLEAVCCRTRARLFMTMLKMAVCTQEECKSHH